MRALRRLAVVLFAIGCLVSTTGAAPSTDLQTEVEAYLAAHPGGQQISATEISYGGGTLVVAVAPASGVEGVPDCPSGWFCFYEYPWYGYPRGKLSDCGLQFLATWSWQNRIDSVHHNQSFGTVSFIDETGEIDTKLFSVSPSKRTISDAGWACNRADYVFRLCG
jgi:hypothetical protein